MLDHHGGRLYDTKVKGQKAKVKGQGKECEKSVTGQREPIVAPSERETIRDDPGPRTEDQGLSFPKGH